MKGPLRNRSLGTKLPEVEYASVEAAALRAGLGLSEWCRRVVLESAERQALPERPAARLQLISIRDFSFAGSGFNCISIVCFMTKTPIFAMF